MIIELSKAIMNRSRLKTGILNENLERTSWAKQGA